MAVLPETKLEIYNGALQRLGSRELGSLTENREPRRVLDGHWGSADKLVKLALERGDWNFAIRTVQGVYSTTVEPDFGYKLAYNKPDDLRRLSCLSKDEFFTRAMVATEYADEAGFWFTDQNIIYIRYVSDDTAYGLDSAKWSEGFKDYLQCDLAWRACERITNATSKRDRIERDRAAALGAVKSLDAMSEGIKFLPHGSWSRSRRNG